MDEELSTAIVAHLRRGIDPGELTNRVQKIVQECLDQHVDWNGLGLGDAGRFAAAETGRRHPELSTEALDALAWHFSFEWR